MKRSSSILAAALLSSTALSWSTMAVAGQQAAPADAVDEVVVRGAFIPEPKRETSEISSFISTEDLEKQGDSNIALSLRRVTGLSLVGGKFIYIRGLGERYSNAMLNGLPLPSPEPLRRVVPLDLFPTAVLASASAQKTYSPQYSAEFGGGLLEIKTKTVPDERFVEVGISGSGNTETTWKNGLLYEGGAYDWAGFDSGTRAIPDPLQAAIDSGKRVNTLNFTDTELQTIGRSLVNSDLWVIFEGTTPGNFGIDLTMGDRLLRGDTSYGILASAGYDNSWRTKRGQQQDGRFGSTATGARVLNVADNFNFVSTQNDIRWHALLGLGADWDNNEVKFTSLLIRNTSKEARTLQGLSANFGTIVRRDYTEWFEREMWTNQIDGLHHLEGDFTVNWKGSYSTASRDAPYERFAQYRDFGSGNLQYDFSQGRNLTRFSSINDTLYSGALDLTKVTTFNEREMVLKAGYVYTDNARDSAQRDYRLLPTGGPLPPQLLFSRIDYIFSDQNINPNRFVLTEVTGSSAPPAYTGSLQVHGAYFGMDAQAGDYVRAALGGRFETGEQLVDTFDFYTPNTRVETTIKKKYWLPAGTITWNFAENMQIRVGASKTIGRPQFRELAPADFIDVDTDRQFVGNPNLKNSRLANFDGRWEWYFADEQYLTLGAFYKKLSSPVEETINEAGDNQQTTFQNVPRAKLYGFEAEFKYILVSPWQQEFLSTKNFFLSSNFTWSESKLSIKPGDTVIRQNGTVLPASFIIRDGRALQGHSRYLANFQVGYEDVEARSAATLLLNYTSKRIRAAAPQTLPEIYERPPFSVDFTYSRTLAVFESDYELSFKAENLLGAKYRALQAHEGKTVNVDAYKLGQSFSLGIKRRF